jgi:hypothetical protein
MESLIKLDINKPEEQAGNEIPSNLSRASAKTCHPTVKHADDSRGLITESRVDTADWKLTA